MIGLTGIAGSLMAARLWAFRRGFSNAQSIPRQTSFGIGKKRDDLG
jgi:hypothetical protein